MKNATATAIKIIPSETVIQCLHCSTDLFTIKNDMKIGDYVSPSLLLSIAPQPKMKSSVNVNCYNCKQHIGYNKFRLPDGSHLTYRMGELIQS
jgi:hypothetical protein